ncbi:MAG: RNA 3'-terminal phosphate cyclase [Thermodesulfobacteriota bacterium]
MLVIDGTMGEGGGQVLRTALSLAALTGQAFTIDNIRGNRTRPGLRRQHLTAVQAAARLCGARLQGAEPDSRRLRFEPRQPPAAGDHHWAVGTAGSTTLVLQTVLPILFGAHGSSQVTVEGGTHNPLAPPVEFLEQSFLPVLATMGCRATLTLERHGFYPEGGGRIRCRTEPRQPAAALGLVVRPARSRRQALVLSQGLPAHVAQREAQVLAAGAAMTAAAVIVRQLPGRQPANVVMVADAFGELSAVCTAFGVRGRPAEAVAAEALAAADAHAQAGWPVEAHLADQLLLYLGLAGQGSFATGPLSLHAETNRALIERFLPVRFTTTPTGGGCLVSCHEEA